jgi:TonB-linked SusC/RagA family outer membrane protein
MKIQLHPIHLATGTLSLLLSITSAAQAPKDTIEPKMTDTGTINLLYSKTSPHFTATSTQTLYPSKLTRMPVTNVLNAMVGQVAGLYTNQNSGSLTSDQVSLSLRGRNPAIYVDGILRPDLVGFDPGQIASITVLKDALSLSTLGVRGANGAILITTRKGSISKPAITLNVNTSFQQSINEPRVLDAYQYAQLYNEGLANDGLPAAYSAADLEAYRTGTDPFGHPNVDWRREILEKTPMFNQYVLNASGGGRAARYFVSLEHTRQTGIFKTTPANTYNTDNDFKRYVIRSTVDVNITKRLKLGVNLFGSNYNVNYTGALPSQLLGALFTTPNNAYPVYNEDGSYGGNQQYQNNLKAGIFSSGYGENYFRTVSANFSLRRELDDLLPGLYVNAVASYYSTLREDINRAKSFAVYQRQVSPTGQVSYLKYGNDGLQANGNSINFQRRYDYLEFTAGYQKQWGRHHLNAVVLANRDNSVNGNELPYTVQGLAGRLAYSFDQRYVLEIATGYNGSNRYPDNGNTKYALFPAAGLAWNIDQEKFAQGISWLSTLKLYGSYGITGNDNPGYFQYQRRYISGNGVIFGTAAGSQGTLVEPQLPNIGRGYEKAAKLTIGLDGSFFQKRLGITAEFYTDRYYDLLIQRGSNTGLLGNSYPDVNAGRQRFSGVDLQLSWQSREAAAFTYVVRGVLGLQGSKVLYIDEIPQPYPWMQRTGERVGRPFGFIADGLFQNDTEIESGPKLEGFSYKPKPGDIRYKDLNNDGIINQFDQAPFGNDGPLITYGLNVSVAYKGFDFFALAQGTANRDFFLSGGSYYAFQANGFGQAYEHNLGRWTPATAATATYPRMTIGFNDNNYRYSSYWMRSGNYLRLKTVELGYSLPDHLAKKVWLQGVRVYIGGTNLLTFSSLEKGIDPEINLGAYPVQRLYTIGINVKF